MAIMLLGRPVGPLSLAVSIGRHPDARFIVKAGDVATGELTALPEALAGFFAARCYS